MGAITVTADVAATANLAPARALAAIGVTVPPAPVRPSPVAADQRRLELLAVNLGALFAVDLPLARRLDALPEDALPALTPTRSGHYTTAVPDPAGRPIYLHSRHDPVDEAKRLVDTATIEDRVCFAVHGLGLGYALAELLRRTPTESFVLVFEPDERVLRRALECVDLAKAIRNRRVCFILEADKGQLFAAIGQRTVMLTLGTSALMHPPSQRLCPAFHSACSQMLADFASFSRTSLNTLVMNGKRTAENITRNALRYASAGGLSPLARKYAGKPAVIVSAGPSLRKNQHLLRQIQDEGRGVLIAVQTMLKPLLGLGIDPDFVTSLDYHDISGRFFEGLPTQLRTRLVAELKATRLVLDMHPGPVTLVGNDYADSLLREMVAAGRLDRPRLRAGATVAHLAFYLARYLGCDPIIMVGQDLGFSDGLCYTPGTSYDDVWRPELSRFCTLEMKQWEQIIRERPILRRIPDVHGGTMYTEERLFTYLQQFERDFAEATERVLDCTEGGALKRGATPMPLADAIERYCPPRAVTPAANEPAAVDSAPRGIAPSAETRAQVTDCLRRRREEAGQIQKIAGETLPLLEEIRDHIADQVRVNRAIARIDVLRLRMNDYGATYDLVTQLTQGTELRRFESDLKLSGRPDLDPHEKQRRQVERDVANCRAILTAATEFQDMLTTVITELAPGH